MREIERDRDTKRDRDRDTEREHGETTIAQYLKLHQYATAAGYTANSFTTCAGNPFV